MKTIELTQGFCTIVDDANYELLSKYKWRYHTNSRTSYAITGQYKDGTYLFMHHLILPPVTGLVVDHINRNGLDNRRENLRYATKSQNLQNRGKTKKNTSGYKGVSWNIGINKWHVFVKTHGTRVNVGYYKHLKEAVIAYNQAAKKYYGEFAYQNPIPPE